MFSYSKCQIKQNQLKRKQLARRFSQTQRNKFRKVFVSITPTVVDLEESKTKENHLPHDLKYEIDPRSSSNSCRSGHNETKSDNSPPEHDYSPNSKQEVVISYY
jgi:hypothetical protein